MWDDGEVNCSEACVGEVSCSGACVGEPPSGPLGGDYSAGPWQRTGAVGKGGPAHPGDRHPQRSVSTEMEDWKFGCWTTVLRGEGGAILTNLWLPMTSILSSAWLKIATFAHTSSLSPWWWLEHSVETLTSYFRAQEICSRLSAVTKVNLWSTWSIIGYKDWHSHFMVSSKDFTDTRCLFPSDNQPAKCSTTSVFLTGVEVVFWFYYNIIKWVSRKEAYNQD